MSFLSAADVYAEQLFRLGHGYPLWDPDPPKGEVLIGDVGFIADGSFHRVFNATKPGDDPANRTGVPDGYKPFTLTSEFSNVKKVGALAPGALCSRTIRQLQVELSASGHGVGAGLEFQCMDDQGAVLVMKHSANREVILPSRRMVNYMSQSFTSWYEFIRDRLDVDIPRESLRFICGVWKTADWAVASYTQAGKMAQFQFNASLGAASAAFTISAAAKVTAAPEQNWGPRDDATDPSTSSESLSGLMANQSVFIHYYSLRRRFLFPKVMKAAAGYDELPPPGPDEAADRSHSIDFASSGEEVNEIERDTSVFQSWDPVDFVLDYILKYEPNVQVAVANDRDINRLCEQHRCDIPDDIPSFLETVKPLIEVTEDGLGMLSHEDLTTLEQPAPDEQTVPASMPVSFADEHPTTDAPPEVGATAADAEISEKVTPRGEPVAANSDSIARDGPIEQKKADILVADNGAFVELEHHAGGITALAYSPDGRYIASGADDTLVVIWDVRTGQRVHTCSYHSDTICSLAFSPDGSKLLSGSGDGLGVIWDVRTGEELTVLNGHTGIVYTVAFSPDGSVVATGSVDTSVRLWDAVSGEERSLSRGHSAIVLIVAFSPDSRRLVSASADYCTRVWSVRDGTLLSVLKGHQGVIYALAYAPDSRRLVTGSDDGSARIWNGETGEELVDLRVHSGSVWAAAFSPDGKQLLSAASDGSIRICDSYSGDKIHEIDASDQLVNATAFSADGSRICASSADNSIRVWNTKSATQLATLTGHSDKVSHLRFSPDATRIVSSSDDGLLRIWDLSRLGTGGHGGGEVEA
ncbi:WD40-repeat-containing domain protein [Rhodofomes roseus]|uniref:WD40-repeat-containing domain protein n=1 Tax=Rhodofomes roseus TaxID=34475 RepID=A0ABQ8KWC7_9APHY|nr:WD40-repeat-containing domain protein [Rhodofomes roseus]KAH9843617.1 WD40-repeat-containing domain protein [Rhodofomes roseus]